MPSSPRLFIIPGQSIVTKITSCVQCGRELYRRELAVDSAWFDEKCDEDPENFFVKGPLGNEVNYWHTTTELTGCVCQTPR